MHRAREDWGNIQGKQLCRCSAGRHACLLMQKQQQQQQQQHKNVVLSNVQEVVLPQHHYLLCLQRPRPRVAASALAQHRLPLPQPHNSTAFVSLLLHYVAKSGEGRHPLCLVMPGSLSPCGCHGKRHRQPGNTAVIPPPLPPHAPGTPARHYPLS